MQCFSEVPSNGLPPSDFSQFKGADSFDTPSFRKIYKVKPIKDVCQVCPFYFRQENNYNNDNDDDTMI